MKIFWNIKLHSFWVVLLYIISSNVNTRFDRTTIPLCLAWSRQIADLKTLNICQCSAYCFYHCTRKRLSATAQCRKHWLQQLTNHIQAHLLPPSTFLVTDNKPINKWLAPRLLELGWYCTCCDSIICEWFCSFWIWFQSHFGFEFVWIRYEDFTASISMRCHFRIEILTKSTRSQYAWDLVICLYVFGVKMAHFRKQLLRRK